MIPIPFSLFQSIPFPHQIYHFPILIFTDSFFYLLLFTMSGYSEYILRISTLINLYSKYDYHGRNISELKNLVVN